MVAASRRSRDSGGGRTKQRRRVVATRVRKKPAGRKTDILTRLSDGEASKVLLALVQRHPELKSEARNLASAAVQAVDAGDVATKVRDVVLGADFDGRSGAHPWGYVEPTEAAWEILQEAIDPFFEEMKRQIELGFESAAVAVCQGIVAGLYQCRGGSDLLECAEDFPEDAAGDAVATLARASAAKHRYRWNLSREFVEQMEDWTKMLDRASGTRRR